MSLAQLILERGAASLADVEACLENQVVYGGDLGTNLVEIGALKENTLHRLLSEYHEMPIGPQGRLPDLTGDLEQVLSRDSMARLRVYPVKLTKRTLHLATSAPLEPETEKALRTQTGLQLRAVVVTPLRLAEALASRCGVPMRERDRRLVAQLESGVRPRRQPAQKPNALVPQMFAGTPPYRRMSEHPEGILPSSRQPKTRRTPTAETAPPDTLDGLGPSSSVVPESGAAASEPTVSDRVEGRSEPPTTKQEGKRISTQPYDNQSSSAPPAPSDAGPDSEAASAPDEPAPDAGGDGIDQAARPSDNEAASSTLDSESADEDGDGKRDTQPWRDDEPDSIEEPTVSLRGEFSRSLSEAPPTDEAKIHEDHRAFRHRGPFTRAQAELAVSQAHDVQSVLEILVRYARQFFERTVLLTVQGEFASLRLAHGLGAKLASFRVPLDAPSVMREAFQSGDPVVRPLARDGVDGFIKRELAVGDRRVAVIPLSIRERTVAMFYGDDRDDGVDRDAVADVTDFTEICAQEVTRIIVRKKRGG